MRTLNFGIPTRMAKAMYGVFMRDGQEKHQRKVDLLDNLLCDDERIPLATDTGAPTGEPAIWHAADAAARECYTALHTLTTENAIVEAIGAVCKRRGIAAPKGETLKEFLARATDKAWWRRHLRNEWKRRFESTSIHLGLTHVRTDPYVSREIAIMQAAQNAANQKLLENRTATNEHGKSYTVADLAALGMGNKAIRRGELMTRINGFEIVAQTLGHVAMFGTITCPGEFHSVGGTNEKYNGASARDGQAHLVAVGARYRSALARAGIKVYGFRIAEPHTDGCPHWHTLFFMDDKLPGVAGRSAYARASALMRRYALGQGERRAPKRAEVVRRLRAQGRLLDGKMTHKEAGALADIELHAWRVAERARQNAAPGAKKNRCKIVRIDPMKGSAAGYIIKYVAKNIDGEGVGTHQVKEGGETHYIAPDLFENKEITPSQRVTYWSQVWGIRQFQQIGGAPVGVWRELRRVLAAAVQEAPAVIKAAHMAAQSIKSKDPAVAKQASYADYTMAQGGPTVGRRAAIKIASREVTINGRYVTYEAQKPVGVYAVAQPEAVYEGVHYRWTITGAGDRAGVAFDLPRTGVNNCTRPGEPAWCDPDMSPAKNKKNRFSGYVHRPEKLDADERPVRIDVHQVDRFKNHARRHAVSHLQRLQRKYPQ